MGDRELRGRDLLGFWLKEGSTYGISVIKNRGCDVDSETHQQEFPWDDEGDYT